MPRSRGIPASEFKIPKFGFVDELIDAGKAVSEIYAFEFLAPHMKPQRLGIPALIFLKLIMAFKCKHCHEYLVSLFILLLFSSYSKSLE